MILFNDVIPFTMKGIRVDIERFHLVVRNFYSLGIPIRIKGSANTEPRACPRGFNQIYNDFMVDERATTPIQTDGTEKPMLYLVPLAGSWGKMTDMYLHAGFVGKLLQLYFPEPYSRTIAAAAVGSDHQARCLWIPFFSHHIPPAPNAFHSKHRRIVIGANVHPGHVVFQVINTIGRDLTKFFVHKIMDIDLLWATFGAVGFSTIFEWSDKLLFLCIYRNDRLSIFLKALCSHGDKLKLTVSVLMIGLTEKELHPI